MFKNILLATDFSNHSIMARKAAVTMVQGTSGKMTVLHVYDKHQMLLDEGVLLPSDFVEQAEGNRFKREIRANMDQFVKPLNENHVEYTEMIAEGKSAKMIVETAKKLGSDLIIMGSHSKKGFVDVSLGGVTRKVGEDAPCPVLIVTNYKGEDEKQPESKPEPEAETVDAEESEKTEEKSDEGETTENEEKKNEEDDKEEKKKD